ncbi:MAG TPA: hypothetical protein VMU59_14165 [Caulobacteraceae bacterium]|nr:hypothetical protein [Caulobacteraceae bacterium]
MTDASAAAPSRAPARAPATWSGWCVLLLSGADNATPAIGRVLGALVCVHLLVILPAVIVGALVLQKAAWATWAGLLAALTAYAPAMIAAIAGLIRWTNPTEPGA